MGRALYRKYRSRSLAEIVGQDHITATLQNALKKGNISHAYLLTGPRGVGKTSIARILAHEVNSLPYDDTATHLDIIEIDAASNRRIDEIRSLREKVHNAPTSAKYKVYIIDEVHMLTKEAFNALLKTLEEPPAHVIFILATTEVHKLPETIISRTQRFSFKPAEHDKTVKHLRYIADEEGIDISDEALALIAEHGGGSFRDSVSLLDQMSNTGAVVDLAAAQQMLGIAPSDALQKLLDILATGTADQLIKSLQALYDQGYQAAQLAKQLGRLVRQELLDGRSSLDTPLAARLLQRLIDVPASHDPGALLEIMLLELLFDQEGSSSQDPGDKRPVATKETTVSEKTPAVVKTELKKQPEQPPKPIEKTVSPAPKAVSSGKTMPLDEAVWQQTLHAVKQKYNTLYGIARMASPAFNDTELILTFGFPFHQKRINEAKNKQILADIITGLTGQAVTITCIVEKNKTAQPPPSKAEPAEAKTTPLETISNIFGSAEVLE